jgi:hypothetical protein
MRDKKFPSPEWRDEIKLNRPVVDGTALPPELCFAGAVRLVEARCD